MRAVGPTTALMGIHGSSWVKYRHKLMRVVRAIGVRMRAKLQKKWRYHTKPDGRAMNRAGPIPPGLPAVHRTSNGTTSLGQRSVSHESMPTERNRRMVPGARPALVAPKRQRVLEEIKRSTASSMKCSTALNMNRVNPSPGLDRLRIRRGAMQAR